MCMVPGCKPSGIMSLNKHCIFLRTIDVYRQNKDSFQMETELKYDMQTSSATQTGKEKLGSNVSS